jgi:multiple sugar transport system substrate-binding protein
MARDVVRPLDDFVADPELGFSKDDLADIPEPYLAANRYAQYGNKLLSFPFTKSNLVLYYNLGLLRKAGYSGPPTTWTELEAQAAAITKQSGRPAWAFSADPSTIDGIIYSHGGQLVNADSTATLFDQPPTVRTLELLQRGKRSGYLTEAAADDAAALFSSQQCAFLMDTSSGRAALEAQTGESFEWDIAIIPHADGVEPVTVMYGPNVCIFKSTPEQEREAWKFIRYFTSTPVTARWARETGYLPVRKSAAERPEMRQFYQQHPRALHVYEILPMAKGEPNVVGWQEVRKHLEDAARAVIGTGTTPQAAAVNLKQKADRTLTQSR